MEFLLYLMLIQAPWLFGATVDWAVWVMTVEGWILGLLLLTKWTLGRGRASRGGLERIIFSPGTPASTLCARQGLSVLGLMTLVILLYGLVAILNARRIYYPDQFRFVERNYLHWLPATFDRTSSSLGLVVYIGLAFSFWAAVEWLLSDDPDEPGDSSPLRSGSGHARDDDRLSASDRPPYLTRRLKRLLWVLSLNGALLGMESILQRLEGGNKLLWIRPTTVYPWADFQFGPYAYRGNAAQYFNLIWPVALGFCWSLRAEQLRESKGRAKLGSGPHLLLVPLAVLIAACPIISTSRGGAFLSLLGMASLFGVFVLLRHRDHTFPIKILLIFALLLLAPGFYLGWAPLKNRLSELTQENADLSAGRLDQYEVAMKMIQDYPLFGVGPRAYETVSQFYVRANQEWFGDAHNDWLQTVAEWGWAGFVLILFTLLVGLTMALNARAPNPILIAALVISEVLTLIHAVFDFPFQIHSILFTSLVLLAVLVSLAFKPPPAPSPAAG